MSRTHNRYRPEIIACLLERDGNVCMGCEQRHLLPPEVRLWRVDHIDGDEDHNCLKNLRLTCNSFNVKVRQKSTVTACVCACGYKPSGAGSPAHVQADPGASDQTGDQDLESMCSAYPEVADRLREIKAQYGTVDPEVAMAHRILDDIAHGRDTPIDPKAVAYRKQLKEQEEQKERAEAERLREQKEDAALTPTMRKNKKSEKPFNVWLTQMIKEGHKYDFDTWCNAGATECKCSPETIRKYLNKRTNPLNGDLVPYADGKKVYLGFRK